MKRLTILFATALVAVMLMAPAGLCSEQHHDGRPDRHDGGSTMMGGQTGHDGRQHHDGRPDRYDGWHHCRYGC